MAKLPTTFDPRVPRTYRHRPKFWYLSEVEDRRPNAFQPTLIVIGSWLDQAGFGIGARIRIDASYGRVVITLAKRDDSDR